MNREIGSAKPTTSTPGRRLGLSRISPRATPKRSTSSNDTTDCKQQDIKTPHSITKACAQKHPIISEDNDSLVTPVKRRKLGRFAVTPKQISDHDDTNKDCSVVKTGCDLREEISQMKAHLEKYEKFQAEKKDLQRLIDTWSEGGRNALRQLQEEIKPQQDIDQILKHLNIPTDIFGSFTDQ